MAKIEKLNNYSKIGKKNLIYLQKLISDIIDKKVTLATKHRDKAKEINAWITRFLNTAFNKKIFSQGDYNSLLKRRDDKKPRSYVHFFEYIKMFHNIEKKIFEKYVKYLQSKGKEIKYKRHGSNNGGKPIIGYFHKEADGVSASAPDYIMLMDEKIIYVEIKRFQSHHFLKLDGLKRYSKLDNILIVVGMEYNAEKIVVYNKKSIQYLLKNCDSTKMRQNQKVVIKVNVIPNSRSLEPSIPLKELFEKKLVQLINFTKKDIYGKIATTS